ncbi:MAG TPA: site-specific integrase [Gemmataceae bacterium]|nr:site-specific integrase [Gemmataceae bacterium]
MPHFPKPYFLKSRSVWKVQIGGKQYNLGPDKEEAFRRYHEVMATPPQQSPTLSSRSISVVNVLDTFLGWCQEHRAPETYEWYRWRLELFARHVGAELPAFGLKHFHIDQWLAANPDWKSGTKHGMARAVQRAFRWALTKGYVDKNPIADFEKARPGKRTKVVSPEEFAKMLSVVKQQQFRDLLMVTWETGCRPQESLAVEARHVDVGNCRWVFPPNESKGEIWPRVVYLTDTALEITKRLMVLNPEGPIFRNTEGRPWQTDSVNCGFIRIQKKLGVKYCLYVLRHSWANHALARGVDALTVAILMGHRDPSTLARTYQHLTQNPAFLLSQAKRATA